jgi:hypothetical protein
MSLWLVTILAFWIATVIRERVMMRFPSPNRIPLIPVCM